MRNRGGIIFLAVIITLLCLFYLSFTLVSRNVQEKANEFARTESGSVDYFKKQAYLDSIWNEPVFLGFSYQDVKNSELNLGLDLQGGMHVTLEVSPAEIITALSGDNDDPEFKKALEAAAERQKNSQENFTTLFFQAFEELAPNTKLNQVFANTANKGRIDFDTDDSDVKKVIEEEVEGAIDRTFNIIRTRIDKFGVSQPQIQRVQGTGRIQIELPGVDNPQRIRKLLQGVAKLEFLEVWTPQEYQQYLLAINDYLVKKKKAADADGTTTVKTDSTTSSDALFEQEADDETEPLFEGGDNIAANDSAALADSIQQAIDAQQAQVSDLFRLNVPGFNSLAYRVMDTSKINQIIMDKEVLSLVPPNLQFTWSVKPQEDAQGNSTEVIQLFVLKKNRGGKAPLTGEVVVDARQSFDQYGNPDISMNMNVEGAKKWKKMTGDNVGNQIAITLDSYVYSAPVVNGEIPTGSSSITGNFTIEEAQDLANVLKAGKLPASPRIVEEVVVGPSLGIEAQNEGIISVVAGLALVVIFMIAYYAKGGLVANVALILNIFFIFGILAQLNAALTLPGIAGIVLTIGMSIDANVLIFERIREEMRIEGNNLLNAINHGYDRAFWTIFDSNVTTFLTGIFLYSFGSGPVKGFAVTLMIGIACSFFSAVYITRVIVSFMTKKGNQSNISFVTPFSKSLLGELNFSFLGKRKAAYVLSGVVIVVGLVVISINGLNYGVDFEGGRSFIVEFEKQVVPSELEVALQKNLENSGVEVKTYGSAEGEKLKITTNYMVDNESTEADSLVTEAVKSAITDFTGTTYTSNETELSPETFTIPSTSKVGATIADDIRDSSFTAGLFSILAIFFYVWVRFRNWRFGLGAIAALFHDVLVVLGIYTIANFLGFGFEVDQVFVAAMLTIIGYSINDTVVVFDRVREYLGLRKSQPFEDTINQSVNSTLNRTLITSFTTLLVVLILFLFGGEVLRGFSFSLLIGIIVGTYSSIFIATPLVYDTQKMVEKQKDRKQGKVKTADA
ncbi:protein translocase subunit SecDF [Chondrinema litorale]|uniref:protein translocase subunit SecDF n=1 Tax=Chondrinema litorale TaxID=2994555 RepID=UPI0025441221|nr:protein translocase subunit SecDF [Chondrinema litorale]UZR92334.1 protein translocase subunit SecDF [Chondrinema litorale]